MEKFKKVLLALLFPPIAVVILAVLVAIVGLVYTFAFGDPNDIKAPIAYVISAYALTVVCARAPKIFRGIRDIKNSNPYVHRYLTDARLRMELSLYISLTVNVLYAAVQLYSGLVNHSFWFYSLAAYYVLLAVVRFFLLRHTLHTAPGSDLLGEFKRYRFCGIILLPLNLALGTIITFIVTQNRGFVHHQIVTIAMAAYTFYSVTMAIINVLKYRRHESPVLLAAKSISLTAALVSLLSLETAMLSAFGDESDALFRRIITGATGLVVFLVVLAMAVYMILRGSREIREIKRSQA